jgi:Domain of unknown function (DUF4252)
MQVLMLIMMLAFAQMIYGQSKSVTRFRAGHKENSNMFFYRSTLNMLNTENNPELADMIRDIEEIRVLNYDKEKQNLSHEDITGLRKAIREEEYNNLMMMNEKNNTIDLYSREKRGKTVGFVALVENRESLILIDLIGSIDVKKFMELKQRLDSRMGNSTN